MAVASNGTLHHVCYIVRDLNRTASRMADTLGIGPWGVWTIRPEASILHDRVVEEMCFRVGIASLGDAHYELIQPISEESVYAEHLAEHGESFHHTCISYPTHEAMKNAKLELQSQGYAMLQSGDLGQMGEFCYFDVPETGPLELLFLSGLPEPDETIG